MCVNLKKKTFFTKMSSFQIFFTLLQGKKRQVPFVCSRGVEELYDQYTLVGLEIVLSV